MKDDSVQERALHCIRRLVLGICNEPQRCSVTVHDDGPFRKLVARPCKSDYPILHGADGRQTHAFMSLAQRCGVQYELVDNHGVEGPTRDHSSYLKTKVDFDDGIALLDELCFLLFGRQMKLNVGRPEGNGAHPSVKVRIAIDRNNPDDMAIVALLADLVYPFSWNRLETVIKVRAGNGQHKKQNDERHL